MSDNSFARGLGIQSRRDRYSQHASHGGAPPFLHIGAQHQFMQIAQRVVHVAPGVFAVQRGVPFAVQHVQHVHHAPNVPHFNNPRSPCKYGDRCNDYTSHHRNTTSHLSRIVTHCSVCRADSSHRSAGTYWKCDRH